LLEFLPFLQNQTTVAEIYDFLHNYFIKEDLEKVKDLFRFSVF
jgi:hypothetical protein